jgi:hypothetical protein
MAGLFFLMLQELAQDFDGVGGIDGGAPGDDVGIAEAPQDKISTYVI